MGRNTKILKKLEGVLRKGCRTLRAMGPIGFRSPLASVMQV